MVFFNAPTLIARATESAVQMALELREEFPHLAERWRARGCELDLGIGVAHGFATVGVIGFEGRRDYGVIGTVTNLAARLCSMARACGILASRPVVGALGTQVDAEFIGDLAMRGFVKRVATFRIHGLREASAEEPCRRPPRSGRSTARSFASDAGTDRVATVKMRPREISTGAGRAPAARRHSMPFALARHGRACHATGDSVDPSGSVAS